MRENDYSSLHSRLTHQRITHHAGEDRRRPPSVPNRHPLHPRSRLRYHQEPPRWGNNGSISSRRTALRRRRNARRRRRRRRRSSGSVGRWLVDGARRRRTPGAAVASSTDASRAAARGGSRGVRRRGAARVGSEDAPPVERLDGEVAGPARSDSRSVRLVSFFGTAVARDTS